MKREGKTLKTLEDGHPRRLSDFRNSWRKMTPEQRGQAVEFILQEKLGILPTSEPRVARAAGVLDGLTPS